MPDYFNLLPRKTPNYCQNIINAIAAAATNSYTKAESDNLFYNKTYLTTALNCKVGANTLNSYYTKTESDN